MAEIVPTILAATPEDYGQRIDRVAPFARRLHIDVADGKLAAPRTVSLAQVYGLEGVPFDLHLMMHHPEAQLEHIISLQPELVVTHFEAEGDRGTLWAALREAGIKTGLAITAETTVEQVAELLPGLNHLLVFTGSLGHNHGQFHADVLAKIAQAREINPHLEIGVDGGVDVAAARLALAANVDVLDCGAAIQEAADPAAAYTELAELAGAAV